MGVLYTMLAALSLKLFQKQLFKNLSNVNSLKCAILYTKF